MSNLLEGVKDLDGATNGINVVSTSKQKLQNNIRQTTISLQLRLLF
jgi:hypothetical protein